MEEQTLTKVRELGEQYLAKYGNAEQATPHFLRAIEKNKNVRAAVAFIFLESLGQTKADAQSTAAETAATDSSKISGGTKRKKKDVHVKAHQRSKPEDHEAAIDVKDRLVRAVLERQVLGRRFMDYTMDELLPLERELVAHFLGHLSLGQEALRDGIFAWKLRNYAQVSDGQTVVGRVVPPAVFYRLMIEANSETPDIVAIARTKAMPIVIKQIEQNRSSDAP